MTGKKGRNITSAIFNDPDILKFYVNRDKELNAISSTLRKQQHVYIEGEPGIGKTTLVNMYSMINPLQFQNVFSFSGYEIELDNTKLAPFQIQDESKNPILLIIDGVDEIFSTETKHSLERLVREGRKRGIRLLMTGRNFFNNKVIANNSNKISLDNLSQKQISELINMRLAFSKLSADDFPNIDNIIKQTQGNPRALLSALQILYSKVATQNELESVLSSKLDYKSGIIESVSSDRNFVLIDDIKVVNKRILDLVNRNPNDIYNLAPRQFEILVAEIFEEKGYNVELTQETRDGGKDLIIVDKGAIGNFMIYAECKRYAPDNPVGVRVVSDLLGRVFADKVTAGIVITSSYFSPDAKTFTEQVKHQMSLVDFVKLNQWMNQLSTKKS